MRALLLSKVGFGAPICAKRRLGESRAAGSGARGEEAAASGVAVAAAAGACCSAATSLDFNAAGCFAGEARTARVGASADTFGGGAGVVGALEAGCGALVGGGEGGACLAALGAVAVAGAGAAPTVTLTFAVERTFPCLTAEEIKERVS